MQRRGLQVVVGAVLVALVAAGCGGSSSKSSTSIATTSSTTSPDSATSSTTSGGSTVDIDCAALRAAQAHLIVPIQYLSQLKGPAGYELITSHTITLDTAQVADALETLHRLDSTSGVSGSPAQAINTYQQANDLAKSALATPNPAASPEGQQLATLVSDTAKFLGGQATISAAYSEVCK
jgi:hypothetical protein